MQKTCLLTSKTGVSLSKFIYGNKKIKSRTYSKSYKYVRITWFFLWFEFGKSLMLQLIRLGDFHQWFIKSAS